MLSEERYKEIKGTPWFNNVRGKLEHIQRFLHTGSASVLVGAGFSRNAEREANVSVKDWEGLALDFHRRLYGGDPQKSDLSLKSALRLASQVECLYGRNELDRIIEEAVPNDKLKPGPLHTALVNLPWRDIFTTNYDQLLETAPSNRSYNVVTNKDTLLYKRNPRIIKLHGSFPDIKPYVISEEDYRKYPDTHPEFVNTVRQSLIESALCLVGFSGDDPNFLNWIGWIRDKMGDNLAPIYLFDVSDTKCHDSELSLLHKRRIEIISKGDGLFQNITEYFDFIFQFLGENPSVDKNEWTAKIDSNLLSSIRKISIQSLNVINVVEEDNLSSLIKTYKSIRESYPGWMFMPIRHLEAAFGDEFSYELNTLKQILPSLPAERKRDLLFELEWRIRMSFTPIALLPWFAEEVDKLIESLKKEDILHNYKLTVLCLSLLSFYRQQYDSEKFDELSELLSGVQYTTDTENIRRYFYEQCLKAISLMDYHKADTILSYWVPAPEDYLGILWKCAIMNEIGQSQDAYTMLSRASLRLQNSCMKAHNLQLLTSTLAAYDSVLRAYEPFSSRRLQNNKDLDEFYTYRYFRFEKERLLDQRDKSQNNDKLRYRTHEFNLNHVINHIAFSKGNSETESYCAGRLQVVWESFGYPYLFNGISINTGMMRLSCDSLLKSGNAKLALNALIRSAQRDTIKQVLAKHIVSTFNKDTVIKLFDILYNKAENIHNWNEGLYELRFSVIVTDILRRFAVILDEERVCKLVQLLLKVRDSNTQDFKNDCLRTIFNCLSNDALCKIYPLLASASIEAEENGKEIIFPQIDGVVNIPDDAIELIRESFNSSNQYSRNNAYLRVCNIYRFCNESQKKILNVLVHEWRNKDMNICINATYSFNVVPYDKLKDNISPEDRLRWSLNKYKDGKVESPVEEENVVAYIGKAEDALCVFEALVKRIPNEDQMTVATILKEKLEKILASTMRSKEILEHAFGRSDNYELKTIAYILANLNYSVIDEEIANNLCGNLLRLAEYGYPKLYAISKINERSNNLTKEEFEKLIQKYILSNDDDARKNAFDFMANAGFVVYREVWSIVWNKIRFSSSPQVADYLSLVMDTAREHPLSKADICLLPDVLYSLYTIKSEETLLDGDIYDIQHQIMRLLGYLNNCDKSPSLKSAYDNLMKEYSEPNDLPNDVKLGFDEGIRIWQKRNQELPTEN